jgi:heme A synthase
LFIGFTVVVIAAGLLLAGWAGIWAVRRRPTNDPLMVGAIAVEVLLLVQAAIGLIKVSGAGLVEPVTFIAYTLGVLLPLPLGFYLARIERTRWGSVSLAFTALVTAVMTLRMLQIWRTTGG